MSSTPSSAATSPTAATRPSIAASCGPCSRLPYVDSMTTWSAWVIGVGSRTIGVSFRPRSPEKTIVRRFPAIGDPQLDDRRAEDVARVVEDRRDAVRHRDLVAVVAASPELNGAIDVVLVVERRADLATLGRRMAIRSGSVSSSVSTSGPRPPTRPPRRPARGPLGLLRWRRFQRSANSVCSFAESRRTISARSRVACVAWIGPRYPAFVSAGMRPQWSRWAWGEQQRVDGRRVEGERRWLRSVSSGTGTCRSRRARDARRR